MPGHTRREQRTEHLLGATIHGVRDRPVHDADRLSDFEALLWTLERDARFASGFANITMLDRPADLARMRSGMRRAAAVVPQLRRRLLVDPLGMTTPRWVDDQEFTIERHVGVTTLDAPGDRDQLVKAALEFCNRPYDTDRPLWEFLLLDGLADGSGAMLQRFHHTVADGVGMLRMSEFFIDLERDGPEPGPPPPMPTPRPVPGRFRASGHALVHGLGRLGDAARNATDAGRGLICNPRRIGSAARGVLEAGGAVTREITAMGRRRSPVWNRHGTGRSLHLLRVPLAAVRATADRQGVSINDVFVTGAAGGAGRYHRMVGSPVDDLRMAMPVSTRDDRAAGGNAFGMARALVSTAADPRERLATVHAALGEVRNTAGVSLVQQLAGVANLLPAGLLTRLTRSQVASVDFTTSNVRGAPFGVFMGGARVLANHPIGPLAGTAFNLTTLSYDGSLDMGLHVDTGAVARPDVLARSIEESFEELIAL